MKDVAGGQRQSPEISLVRPDAKSDPDFECKNPEFNDYYRVTSYSDMEAGLNRTWRYIDGKGATLGYITVAAAHLRPGRDPALQGMGYGNIPALLVGYLATDKDHERQGVATDLLAWSIEEAIRLSQRIGCRIVMLNPLDDPDTMRFYRNLGFRYIPAGNGEDDVFYIDIQDKIKADARPLLANTTEP